MLRTVETIKAMIVRDGVGPDVERVRDVDRRLRLCKNPEKVIGSKAYHARRAEEEAKEKQKRDRKAVDAKRATDAGDPFGEELSSRDSIDPSLDDDDD